MPKTTLGVYSAPAHYGPQHEVIYKRNQFPLIKTMDFLPQRPADFHKLSPNSWHLFRDFPLSDQHWDMWQDPEGTADRHAADWDNKLTTWEKQGKLPMGRDKVIVMGINEPEVWRDDDGPRPRSVSLQQSMADRKRDGIRHARELFLNPKTGTRAMSNPPPTKGVQVTARYYERLLRKGTEYGLLVAGLHFPVGWPTNYGVKDAPPDWSPFEGVHQEAVRGGHPIVLDEYWDHEGPQKHYGWWFGRFEQCPWRDVWIILGEMGIEEGISDLSKFSWGWQAFYSDKPQVYADQLAWADQKMLADGRIYAAAIYMMDFADKYWHSMDITPMAHLLPINTNFTLPPQSEPGNPPPLPPPPPPQDDFEKRVIATGNAKQVIQYNKDAALQKAMVRDGFMPNSPEYQVDNHICQRAESLVTGEVRYYIVPKGQWDKVTYIKSI